MRIPHPFKTLPVQISANGGISSRKISSGLIAGILALNLIVAAVLGWLVDRSADQANLGALRSSVEHLQGAEESISGVFDRTETTLGLVGDQYKLFRDGRATRESLSSVLTRANATLRSPYGVRIADHNGLVTYGDAGQMDGQVRIASQSYFMTLRDNAKASLAISSPMASKVADQSFIIVAKRISERDGTFIGIAFTAIPVPSLAPGTSNHPLAPGEVIELRNDKFGLIAIYPASREPVGTAGSDNMPPVLQGLKAESAHEPMTYRTTSADGGITRQYYLREIDGKPLFIVAGAPTAMNIIEWQVTAGVALTVFILILLGSSFAGLWVYRVWRYQATHVQSLAASEAAFRSVFDNAPVGMELVSLDGKLLKVNVAQCELLGYTMEELVGKPLADITDPDDIEKDQAASDFVQTNTKAPLKREKRYIHKNGRTIWTQRTVVLARDISGKPSYLIAQIEDITQRKEEQTQIEGFAYLDTLTGLPNRRTLMDRLSRGIKQAAWSNTSLGLLFIDLDGFKKINDTLGHDIGDEILKVAASRLKSCVRGEDTVARQGGDEFVIIIKELSEPTHAALVAQKVVTTMAVPIQIGEQTLRISASIGVAISPPAGGVTIDELIKQADTAMYWTKQAGRNGYRFYEDRPENQPLTTVSNPVTNSVKPSAPSRKPTTRQTERGQEDMQESLFQE